MSELPEAVRRQVERAEQLQKEQMEQDTSKQETPSTEEVQQEPAGQQVRPETPKPHQPEHNEWQSKYQSLKGKYDAEVPRLHHDLRTMRDQISVLNQQLQAKQQEVETPAQSDLNPEAFDEYGEDFRLLVDKLKQAEAEIARLKGDVGAVAQGQAQTRTERFWADVNQLLPGWEEQNSSPAFQQWLGEVDPVAGVPRQAILDRAQTNLDAQHIARIFNAWPGKQAPAQKTAPRSSMEAQVAPNNSGVSGGETVSHQVTYSRADVSSFYRQVAGNSFPFKFKGKLVKNNDDARQIEMDFHTAMNEGRIL